MIAIVLGTRPEIIKLSPVIRELLRRKIKYHLIHTNQHYSKNMDKIFFRELGLPNPNYNLSVGGLDRSQMISKVINDLSKIFKKAKYTHVIVQGDTNSVLAASLCANFEGIPLSHVEAGLRSYDKLMPEEINRVLIDRLADLLFCPTLVQKKILQKESVRAITRVVGNTISDSVKQNLKIAIDEKDFNLGQDYAILTLHRPSNVEYPHILKGIIEAVYKISKTLNIKIIFPVHPRTLSSLNKYKVKIDKKHIEIIEPVGYFKMLHLIKNSKLIITDSGGLQEEACILKTPCVTVRHNTERPETITVGANILVGTDMNNIIEGAKKMIDRKTKWKNPFGVNVSKKIVDIILKYESEKQ